jgi:hypothetical protein
VEDEVVGSRPIGCMCKLPIKTKGCTLPTPFPRQKKKKAHAKEKGKKNRESNFIRYFAPAIKGKKQNKSVRECFNLICRNKHAINR